MIDLIGRLASPYQLGYQHAKLAFTDQKIAEVAKRSLSDRADQRSAPAHLFVAVLLWIPLVNYFVQFILQQKPVPLSVAPPPSPPPKPEMPATARSAAVVVGSQNFESEDGIIDEFINKLLKADKDNKSLDEVFYKQCYDNLIQFNFCTTGEERELAVERAATKIEGREDVPDRLRFFAAQHLRNECALDNLQSTALSSSQSWEVIKTPGDGSCMLWSYLIAERLEHDPDTHRYENFSILREEHPEYKSLHEEMMALRQEIVKKFKEDIRLKDNDEFRRQFVYYVVSNPEVSDQVITDEATEDLMVKGIPTQRMIDNYCAFISKPDTWNGEFEAKMLADLKERSIFILSGREEKNFSLGTAAGKVYIIGKDPIFIRHSGSHYDALIPNR